MDNDFINFEDLRLTLEIKDPSLFQIYLKELYKDLSDRAESNRKTGISKITFWEYMKLPVFISEKLFYSLDCDNDSFLSSKEFTEGLYKLYMGNFEETVDTIFNILDFDKDGSIEKGDVRILLTYLPLKTSSDINTILKENNNIICSKNNNIQYNDQLQSLTEIDEILKQTFGDKNEKLNINEFSSIIQNKKSDIFLQLICFLYLNKPFNEQNIDTYQSFKKKSENSSPLKSKLSVNIGSNSGTSSGLNSPSKTNMTGDRNNVRMPSPSRKSLLQPVGTFLQLNLESNSGGESDEEFNLGSGDNNDEINEKIKINLPEVKKKNLISEKENNKDNFNNLQFVRFDNTKVIDKNKKENIKGDEDVKEVIKNSKGILDSPSVFFKRNKKNVSEFNLEDNLINLDDGEEEDNNTPQIFFDEKSNSSPIKNLKSPQKNSNSPNILTKKNSTSPSISTSPNKRSSIKRNSTIKQEVIHENWVYKLTDNNKIKKYFLMVIGKDIYYYKTDLKEDLLGMHNLSGCFVKEGSEKKIDGKKFYSFSIIFSSKTRNYYTLEKNEVIFWITSLKKAIGYQSFFDYYDIINDLGEGKFGMVKLGIHKKTGEKVAIKIIKKDSMTINDMELVRSEIDIMKLCKHPNVVRLLDHFENSEYIFIVMEYLSGGDLGEFFIKKQFKFDEPTAAKVILQIASGINYIHQFGIVHRDLKPENIMLTDNNALGLVKVMDFGLSKILGPLEKAVDGFGTLSFVAPEVLVRQPYNKQIDIWSIGVILYYMLSGILPFDDESDNEEIIAKRVVFVELQFPSKYFKGRSNEVLDLINQCLIKDPLKRISIENVLKHDWILSYTK